MGTFILAAFAAGSLALSGVALAAETATSRQMRDYYQALKSAKTLEERESEIKDGYKNKVGAAATSEFKKNQEEFRRQQPPFHMPKKIQPTDEDRKLRAEKRRLDKAERAKSEKSLASSESSRDDSGRPAARLPVPDNRPPSREEVVIDGRDVPAELEFPGKRPAASPTPPAPSSPQPSPVATRRPAK